MFERLIVWLQQLGLSAGIAKVLAVAAGIVAIALLGWIANAVAKQLILRAVRMLVTRTETKWDDALLERQVFNRLSHLAPALVIYRLVPVYFASYLAAAVVVQKLVQIYMIVVGLMVLSALLSAVNDIYRTFEVSKNIPLKGFIQVIKVVLYCLAGIVVLAILLDKTPLYLLSGVGAMTAVLLIVFKDPILGFVAGIQLSGNKMIAIGDWIAMPSHGADGDVIEVALTTVKVRNWDKTITTIPTYDLITKSFKNWRGMTETGGRRIKRAINLDLNSIRFLDAGALAKLEKVQLLSDYLAGKKAELAEHNARQEADLDTSLANGRRLTNVGTFRAYVEAYLHSLPQVHKGLTFLVRQLAPGEHGLPIQVYIFTTTTAWVEYEAIQSDIFDHLFAVVPEFGLRVFQEPTGHDFTSALARTAS